MKIEILGMGCQKCNKLAENAKAAAAEAGIQAELTKVENFKEIARYGVMTTPALVVNGVVTISGKVPSKDEILTILKSSN